MPEADVNPPSTQIGHSVGWHANRIQNSPRKDELREVFEVFEVVGQEMDKLWRRIGALEERVRRDEREEINWQGLRVRIADLERRLGADPQEVPA